MKHCPKCERDLPLSAFKTRKRRGRVVSLPRCIECAREDNRESVKAWRNANPENKLKVKDHRLRSEYGITLADWQTKLAAQGGLCAICKQPMTEKINVDHDHVTGEVRDLLCSGCNGGLGCFRDDPALLGEARAYLTRWGGK